MSKLVVDVMGGFVAGLKLESKVLSFSVPAMLPGSFSNSFSNSFSVGSTIVPETTTITVCDMFHARPGLACLLDGIEYTIMETDRETGTVTVAGYTEAPALFSMPAPHYFHGTPTATGAEISRLRDADKVPMIYLLEIIRETVQGEDSAYVSVADLRLFFLDVADYAKWTTDDHYAKAVQGLRSLADAFITQARKYRSFGKLAEIDLITHVKFGVYQTDKGHVNSLFNERLTGIEMRASFPIRDCSPKCC
jgi:hypothetical protein